jgi:putative Mg2+ transporter-C (MgtC) family protein
VALGSALFILIPLQSGISQADLSRVLQGLVAGIGFVGAGSIMHADGEKNSVQGLTTAASIWMTAAIGAAVGMGRDVLAILATLIAYFVLAFVHINDRTWN